MFSTYCLLLLLGPHGVLLSSQMEELHVTFISTEYPTVKVKADCSDDDLSGGPVKMRVYRCSTKRKYDTVSNTTGVCKEDGVKVCLSPLLRDEECVRIVGRQGDVTYVSPELSLTNVTFLNRRNLRLKATPWEQRGNTSVMRLQPVAGVPIYTLRLEGDGNNKENSSCNTVFLTGDAAASSGSVTFTAHWHRQVAPRCTYRVWFMAKDECLGDMIHTYHTKLPELQYIQPGDKIVPLEEPKDMIHFVAAVGVAASMILVAMAMLFALSYQTKKYQRFSSQPQRPPPMEVRKAAPSARPAVLLVHTPNLHPQMAALAARLKEMTGLQIEDLHDVGDQDKLNDPTVWVTRRLMDANTRFVLACSTVHHDKDEMEEGSAVHFLLDHFLQYLRSSRLAYDYTRLHLVRLEGEPHVEVRDVTPGRVYRLPADLPQLARNLSLATPTTTTTNTNTTSPQGRLQEAC